MASISMKRVLLGSAAGILATATAQAADLPVKKAAAVQYVRVCTAYGAGFFEIPGTDMCVKLTGQKLGIDFSTSIPKDALVLSQGANGTYAQTYFNKSAADYIGYTTTARSGVDVRSPTEYGTLRAVALLRIDLKHGTNSALPPAGTGSAAPTCYRCYIEWAGFLAGNGASAWPYLNEDDVFGSLIDSKISITLVQYSWKAPGGWSGSFSFEDPAKHFAGGNYGSTEAGLNLGAQGGAAFTGATPATTAFTLGAAVTYGPTRFWDMVGVVNLEGDWGNATVRGALHQISMIARGGGIATTGGNTTLVPTGPSGATVCPSGTGVLVTNLGPPAGAPCAQTGAVNVQLGWAAQAGITFKLPALGAKDQLLLQAVYADGATDYTGWNQAQITGMGNKGDWAGGLMRDDRDAIAINNGDGSFRMEKEKSWAITAQLRHYWAPLWRSNFMFNYADITPGTTTQNTDWTLGGLGKANKVTAGVNLIWGNKPKTSEIGLEVLYQKANQTLASAPGVAPTPLPAGIVPNGDNWTMHLAWERAW
jgi:hypothetical protein